MHEPVLLSEVLQIFAQTERGTLVDATFGMGGHSSAILDQHPDISILGIDRDKETVEAARERMKRFGKRCTIVYGNFADIIQIAAGVGPIAGVLADLGVSSMQFDSETRGFSFRFDAPLDMRMDPDSGDETAAELLATRTQDEIANIIYEYGEERASRRIARRIIERRERGEPVETTKQLADLVAGAVRTNPKDKIHPATRTFQALRIAVNDEIGILDDFLKDAIELIEPDGIVAIISFHSLEDRIVKQAFRRAAGQCQCPPRIPQCVCGAKKIGEILTKRPLTASEEEINRNPRSRSAKLRAFRKTKEGQEI
jgi:16S rRNA (cytosine1402-N4)-methyltransferase